MGQTLSIAPPPYDVHNLLNLLGIEIDEEAEQLIGRLTVTHPLIAGTGYLWAPVVVALADALCAFGVSRNWPEGATSFTTVEAKANFLGSAKEGELVTGLATPLHVGRTTQVSELGARPVPPTRSTRQLQVVRDDGAVVLACLDVEINESDDQPGDLVMARCPTGVGRHGSRARPRRVVFEGGRVRRGA